MLRVLGLSISGILALIIVVYFIVGVVFNVL
jgi:hypothetical protein